MPTAIATTPTQRVKYVGKIKSNLLNNQTQENSWIQDKQEGNAVGNTNYPRRIMNWPKAFASKAGETNKIFMGFELEFYYDTTSSTQKAVVAALKNLGVTNIGTRTVVRGNFLRGIGLTKFGKFLNGHCGGAETEMISVPATLTVHQEYLEEFFASGLTEAIHKKKNEDIGNGAGLHIHVDKRCFSEQSLMKLLTFFSDTANHTYIEKMAGRFNYYNMNNVFPVVKDKNGVIQEPKGVYLADKTDIRSGFVIPKELQKPSMRLNNGISNTGRRQHVSVQSQKQTLEFRVFCASHRKEYLMKRLEFVDAIVRYTRVSPWVKLTVPDFCAWLNKQHNKPFRGYDYLRNAPETQEVLGSSN